MVTRQFAQALVNIASASCFAGTWPTGRYAGTRNSGDSRPHTLEPMSISPNLAAPHSTAVTPAGPSTLSAWMREPLLHFVVLGGLLFAIDHYFIARDDDPRTIVVSAEVDQEASNAFKAARGRKPSAAELQAMRQTWLDNEVLYRDGLAMRLDKGDSAIRDRVIFKALSVVDAATKLPPADERDLRRFFDAHRDKYDEPARFDFQEATVAGERSESAIRALVATINSGGQGDAKAGLQIFKGRPRSNLVLSYGASFAETLEEASPGEWRAYSTSDGWRAIRLESVTPAKPVTFEAVQGSVRQDWADEELAAQRTAAVRAKVHDYKVKIAVGPK